MCVPCKDAAANGISSVLNRELFEMDVLYSPAIKYSCFAATIQDSALSRNTNNVSVRFNPDRENIAVIIRAISSFGQMDHARVIRPGPDFMHR